MMKFILYLALEAVATQSLPAQSLDFHAPVRRLRNPSTPMRRYQNNVRVAPRPRPADRLRPPVLPHPGEGGAPRYMEPILLERPTREEALARQVALGDPEARTRLWEQSETRMNHPDGTGAEVRASRTKKLKVEGALLRWDLRAAEIEEIGRARAADREFVVAFTENHRVNEGYPRLQRPAQILDQMYRIENELIRLGRRNIPDVPALEHDLNVMKRAVTEYYQARDQRAATEVLNNIIIKDSKAIIEMADNANYWSSRSSEMVILGVDAGAAVLGKAVGAVGNAAANTANAILGASPLPAELRTQKAFLKDMLPQQGSGQFSPVQQRAANELKDLLYLEFMHWH